MKFIVSWNVDVKGELYVLTAGEIEVIYSREGYNT